METKNQSSLSGETRRTFIKTTSAVLGGAALASIAPATYAAGADEIKVALIGCGGRGTGAASQALSTNGPVKLVAMADAFKDKLEGSYKQLKGAKRDAVDVPDDRKFVGFEGYKHAIAAADLVILTTPPGFRPLHFAEAVEQGKHVFMEKPVASDSAGVRTVLEYGKKAREKGLAVGVGLQRHHQNSYLETMDKLKSGAIGDIISTRCYWNGTTPWVRKRQPDMTEMEYQMRNWYFFTWLCGDHIVEQHIHNIDIINWLKGTHPIKARGMGGREVRRGKDFGEIYDHHTVEFIYPDGSHCLSQCRHQNGAWSSVSEHAVGTKGRSDISGGRLELYDGTKWRHRAKNNDPYQTEHDELFKAIREGRAKEHNEAENGAIATMTAIFGRIASYSGREVDWDRALNSQVSLMPTSFAWDANPPVLPGEDGIYPAAVPGVWDKY